MQVELSFGFFLELFWKYWPSSSVYGHGDCLMSHARDVEMSPKMMQPLHGPAAIDDFSSYRFIEDLW